MFTVLKASLDASKTMVTVSLSVTGKTGSNARSRPPPFTKRFVVSGISKFKAEGPT